MQACMAKKLPAVIHTQEQLEQLEKQSRRPRSKRDMQSTTSRSIRCSWFVILFKIQQTGVDLHYY